MVKTKKKTQISAFVGQELGEWLREFAFKSRMTQAEVIRDALIIYKAKSDKEIESIKKVIAEYKGKRQS